MKKLLLLSTFLMFSFSLLAQTTEFNGKVLLKGTEIAVEGAVIKTKGGAKYKTSTNHLGEFYIPVVNGDFSVNISKKYYVTVSKNIKQGEDNIVFYIEITDEGVKAQDKQNLTSQKSKITESTGSIKADKSINTKEDLMARLMQIPGVMVSNGVVRIRGNSSINSSNAPLIIVDGIRTESFDGIDVQNIASVEVLKGSAASIYGMQGSNSVIVITTKSK